MRSIVVATDYVACSNCNVTVGACFLALRSNRRTKLENKARKRDLSTFSGVRKRRVRLKERRHPNASGGVHCVLLEVIEKPTDTLFCQVGGGESSDG